MKKVKMLVAIVIAVVLLTSGCAGTGMKSKTVAERIIQPDGTIIEKGVQELGGVAVSALFAKQKEIYARRFEEWEAGLGFQESQVNEGFLQIISQQFLAQQKILQSLLAYRQPGGGGM